MGYGGKGNCLGPRDKRGGHIVPRLELGMTATSGWRKIIEQILLSTWNYNTKLSRIELFFLINKHNIFSDEWVRFVAHFCLFKEVLKAEDSSNTRLIKKLKHEA